MKTFILKGLFLATFFCRLGVFLLLQQMMMA